MVKIGELYFSVISFLSNLMYFSLCIQKHQSAHDSIGFPRLLEVPLTHRPNPNGQECFFSHLTEGFGLSTSIPGAAHRKWGELSITLRWEPHPWLCLMPWVLGALCFISSKINRLLLGGKGQICHLAGVDLWKKADSLTFQPSPPLPCTSTLHLRWLLVPQLQRGLEVLWPNGMSLKGFLVMCFLNFPQVQLPSYLLVLMG